MDGLDNTAFIMVIETRNYDKWKTKTIDTMEPVDLNVNPAKNKLFSMDVFRITERDGKEVSQVKIEKSPVRTNPNISGVLILKNNKTYGRYDSNGKLLYKCIPDDKRIPVFLVPYEMKYIGFSKNYINLYVTFQFAEWKEKHPIGKLSCTIGKVDSLDNYYEYQLYCKSLNASIHKFVKDTKKSIKERTMGSEEDIMKDIYENYKDNLKGVEDRTGEYVYTIDPQDSTDFDDAVSHSLVYSENYSCVINKLSIYISNVTLLLDHLQIWESFSKRVSTIYLPDRKRPMLPTILSDGLCSLTEGKTRFAFTLDLFIHDGKIVDYEIKNTMINVVKNFRYEEDALLNNDNYKSLVDLLKCILPEYRYIPSLRNSHDMVAYLMILTNNKIATKMLEMKKGVFRNMIVGSSGESQEGMPESMDHDVLMFFKMWNGSSAQYLDMERISADTYIRHDLLKMDAYLQITSPIRRLVDLLNMLCIQKNENMITLSSKSEAFYNIWTSQMEYINTSMRSIRKLQNDCQLITLVSSSPEILESSHVGYVFDKIDRDGILQYTVFIPSIKLVSKLTTTMEMKNYDKYSFKLHLIQDEDNIKRKVRVSVT
tara:strand:- start:137 stop:1927 length:1791 start_codon:yes stop_codon:yes gene_type:complete